jgi:peptide/nickel transport system ATP-binding protein
VSAGASVIEAQGLRVGYRRAGRELVALRGVSLELRAGVVLALVGESGSGKSTLALALCGALPDNARVLAGRILFEGRDVTHASSEDWRALRGAGVALQFQDPQAALDPLMRVGEQVAEGPRFADGLARDAARARALEILAEVGLPEPERPYQRFPHELSGGMRQRALLACALARRPRALIADEPTSALDPTLALRVLALLRERAHASLACLWITHDLASVAWAADEIAVQYAGAIVERGPARSVLANPRHPYTRALHAASLARECAGGGFAPIAGASPRLDALPSGCAFRDRLPDRSARVLRARACARPDCRRAPGRVPVPCGAAAVSAERDPVALVRDVHVSFAPRGALFGRSNERVLALRGVSLAIAPGEIVALVGESGSGKSTLGRLLAGLVRADLGRVEIASSRAGAVGIVFQDPQASLNPRLTVGAAIAEVLGVHARLARAAARTRVSELLLEVGLEPEHARAFPQELSGGQRQRAAIARALAAAPKLLVCDEPLSALDVSVQAQVLALLAELRRREGLALLFITHDLVAARAIADRAAVMYAGRIVEVGDATLVLERPAHPYTRALLDAQPRLEARDRMPLPLRGEPPSGSSYRAVAVSIHAARWPSRAARARIRRRSRSGRISAQPAGSRRERAAGCRSSRAAARAARRSS